MDPAADRAGAGPVDRPLDLVTAAVLARKDHGGRPRDAAALGRFCRALLQRVAATELAMTDPDEIAPEVIAAYDLLADRPDGRTAVRVAPLDASLFGPEGGRTVIEVAGHDRPLLFSTVLTALRAAGLDVLRFSHPILGVDRAADGSVLSVGPAPGATDQEVLVHMEVGEALDHEARGDVADGVREAIDELDRAAADLDAVRRRVAAAAERIEELGPLHFPAADCGEAAAFCRWLLDGNFLFVGLRHHPHDGTLGVPDRPPPDDLAPLAATTLDTTPLVVRRSRRTSLISRPERLAEVLVADLDDGGSRVGVIQILGLTSLRGRSERPSGTPWISAKLRRVLAREQVLSGSHDETVLRTIFDGLPWDLLLLADVDWMRDTLVELLAAQQTGGPAVRLLPEPAADALTVLVGVPQESFRAELAVEIELLLDRTLELTGLESETELSGSGLTMLSTVARLEPGTLATADLDVLRSRLRELSRSWSERLSLALGGLVGPDGTALARRWLHRLPAPYREATAPEVAAHDVLALDEVDGTGDVRLRIVADPEDGWHHLRLAVGGPPLELSGFLPVLESVGLVVAAEMTYAVDPADRHPAAAPYGDGPASVMDLRVSRADRSTGPGLVDPEEGARLGRAVLAAWSGRTDVDRLNELVLRAARLTRRSITEAGPSP
jgi:glutamate dehydrogenase